MPFKRLHHALRLEFAEASLTSTNLSGLAMDGEWMWVAGDESAGIERLRRLSPVGREWLRYGESRSFPLAALLDLPGADDDEADLEGLAIHDGWLWLAGSHALKRKTAKPGKDDARNARRLAKLALDGNRRLLARVPIEHDADGTPRLVRQAADGRCAQRLQGDGDDNALVRLLRDDPRIGPFLAIPGKDNGFDIEGLAVHGDRLLLGLRGPVLRGWAVLLELAPTADDDHATMLKLGTLDGDGLRVRQHLFDLGGMGVRDLLFDGDDLLLLAGPTMVLDGDVRLYRWTGAAQALSAGEGEPVRFHHHGISRHTELPHAVGHDRAEAITRVPDGLLGDARHWAVLYDSPSPRRHPQARVVFGDLLVAA
jgi:hypothetical protein